ncbi:MAG: prolyl oligopeptidase family serine peptidase [Clostridia bacterium]|nr:prolyl oligopeptidase family serine peptidase [Clostridia bacterium]
MEFSGVKGKIFNYMLYIKGDATKEKLPLIVLLHGAGERGDTMDDLPRVLVHGTSPVRNGEVTEHFVMVCPQCPTDSFWIAEIPHIAAFIDEVVAEYNIDESRIALTGISMGGFGAWCTALRYPERFYRLAPVCGGGMPWAAGVLKMPIRAFHGEEDSVVKVSNSIDMVEAVKRAGNEDVELTLYPGVGHDSWTRAYTKELYGFLLGK